MSTQLKKWLQVIKDFFSTSLLFVKKNIDEKTPLFWGAVAILVLAIVGCFAYLFVSNLYTANQSNVEIAFYPTILPTSADMARLQAVPTTTIVPTQTAQPTQTPLPANLWQVTKLLGPQNGALVVEFTNTTNGEIKKGQCQSPHDPAPIVGDIFISEVKGDHILLSPTIPNTGQIDLENKTQRFIFLP